ncbi:hypothetical protein V8F20_009819 [Naviculisporaceae sp. PSN 640]
MNQHQARPRRAYQRHTAEVWNRHRDTIRRLFLDQDKTYKEVVTDLARDHGLNIGERQLKRKTEEWGFFKNIPKREMDKMIRTQAQRRRYLGRATQFRRKQGDGEYHDVPLAKIALHETRLDMGSLSPASSNSSGLPSNIECFTPPSLVESEPNSETVTTATSDTPLRPYAEPTLPPASAVLLAADYAMEAKYDEAASHFRQLGKLTSSPWGSVLFDFNADIMDVASNGGCPETIAIRVSSILSQYLFRERERHRMSSLICTNKKQDSLRKVLSGLRLNARFWGSVVVQQRALQIWEPLLGADHPKIVLLRKGLALKRKGTVVNLDTATSMVKTEDSLLVRMELDILPSLLLTPLEEEDGLLYLGDGPPDQLLGKLEDLEWRTRKQSQHALAMLRFGRSRALAGLYYSFAERFTDAQIAFHDSAETLEYETCVEIKLHRILWDAEHKTRIHDWEGARGLLYSSHKVFLDAEGPSEFLNKHFMDRFEVLARAVDQRVSVDKVSGLWDMDELRGRVDSLELPVGGMESLGIWEPSTPSITQGGRSLDVTMHLQTPLSAAVGRGANMGVDIGAWREFVRSSLSTT